MRFPIDPELLRPASSGTLGQGRALPAEAYASAEVLAWETQHFYEAGWVCLGRADDLSEAGDQRAYRVGREGVLVVRGSDGTLRGFYNTCRHRGHELLGAGERRSLRAIKCPYHAWVYRLDGTLGAAPRFGDVEGFRTQDYPLIDARVEIWRGWLFVNASGDAPGIADAIGNLEEVVAPWEPERLFIGAAHHYEVEANWKTITEHYHGFSHRPSIHPELGAVTRPNPDANAPHDGLWVGGSMALQDFAQTMSLTGASAGARIRGLSDAQACEVTYVGLFPNLLLSLHPDYVMTHRIEPLEPGRTRVECQWLFPPEAREVEGFSPAYATEFWDITNREDGVRAFMAMVARGYLDGRATTPPQVDGSEARAGR